MSTEQRSLTGLRVKAEADGGLVYGVARVRYNDGHIHAGNYEVERRDGTSFLAPFDACTVGDNWDDTPENGRFVGAEIFRPAFLDSTRRKFLHSDHGVVVPGSMKQFRELADKVKPGWAVSWYSHGANEFRGDVRVASVEPWGLRISGPKGAPETCRWPDAGDEFDVIGGIRLDYIRVPPRRTGKSPSRSLSLAFHYPRPY